MSNPCYPEEFKIEAVKQVTERGLLVAEVAARLGISTNSLYAWVKRYSKPQEQRAQRTISTLNYVVCVLNSSA
jgi:transposase